MSASITFRIWLDRLSKDRTLFLWIGKYLIVFAAFLGVFIPTQKQMGVYAAKRSSMVSQIEDIKKMSVNLLNPVELETIRQKNADFEKRIIESSKISRILDLINDEAEKNKLKVVQIYSDNPSVIRDGADKELEYAGKKLYRLPVNFRLEADYKSFTNFLHALSLNPEAQFVVETFHLQRGSAEAQTLQCDITLGYIAR